MALPGITAQEYGIPAIADRLKNKKELEGYSYKYIKADMDDLAAMSELELIMTQGINGSGDVVILNKDKYTFMSQCFLIIEYLLKNAE